MTKSRKKGGRNHLIESGMIIAIGVALHNFPEGLAIGSGFDVSLILGINLALVIAFHDVPEGLAVALPMKAGGLKNVKILLYTCLSGLPTAFGALFGVLVGEISNIAITLCLSFAGGAMLYIVCGDIIPESKRLYGGRISTIGNILGILVGIFISLGFH